MSRVQRAARHIIKQFGRSVLAGQAGCPRYLSRIAFRNVGARFPAIVRTSNPRNDCTGILEDLAQCWRWFRRRFVMAGFRGSSPSLSPNHVHVPRCLSGSARPPTHQPAHFMLWTAKAFRFFCPRNTSPSPRSPMSAGGWKAEGGASQNIPASRSCHGATIPRAIHSRLQPYIPRIRQPVRAIRGNSAPTPPLTCWRTHSAKNYFFPGACLNKPSALRGSAQSANPHPVPVAVSRARNFHRGAAPGTVHPRDVLSAAVPYFRRKLTSDGTDSSCPRASVTVDIGLICRPSVRSSEHLWYFAEKAHAFTRAL